MSTTAANTDIQASSEQQPSTIPLVNTDNYPRIVVIGSGPTGMRFVHEMLARQPDANITLFGNEPYAPYNRVQLSSVLAGDVDRNDIALDMPDVTKYPNFQFVICAIKQISPESRQITDTLDRNYYFERLVIATGSRPFVPNIPGIEQTGVYTFRNLKDTDALYARLSSSKHIVVVGGGLLGIEAARALQRLNTKVTLIQQSDRLMNRQLDDEASSQLLEKLQALDINVMLSSGVRVVHGMNRVEAITTRAGEKIACDTVLFCTGITTNSELAREAKLKIGKGIVVNDQLKTSDENIFAIGECCEFNGQTYGLVAPGLEQAAIVADVITGGQSHYAGSQQQSRLKVVGEHVVSQGEITDFPRYGSEREMIYRADGIYRKLVIRRGRLVGMLGIGDWPELPRIQELLQQNRRVMPWQLWWFRTKGKLWLNDASNDVNLWPKAAIVCQCNSVCQGTLVEAIENGCTTREALSEATGAGTVCGSCKPLLQQLTGYQGPPEKEKAWPLVLMSSLVALAVAALIYFIPGFVIPDTVQENAPLQQYWNDKFWKQVSGFTLLGLSAIGLLMSIRKRINSARLGEFAFWRIFHIVLGLLCVSILIIHTGFHLGSNLNQYLMINFLLVIGLGAIAGMSVAMSHHLKPAQSQSVRKGLAWLHLLVSWPLPILLIAHITTVYYF